MGVTSDGFDHAAVAGQPAIVDAGGARPGARFEFDLDGDGDYEHDNGARRSFETMLSAGPHVIGARITDTRGGVVEQRITTFVYQPTDTYGERVFVRRFEPSAVAGEPIDLTAFVEPTYRVYQVEWDADGDGAFDDGTSTTPGGGLWESSMARTTFTYPTPGVYDQRVRVSREGLPTRIFSARIFVSDQPVDRTPGSMSFGGQNLGSTPIAFGEPSSFEASAGSVYETPVLTFDLDGDGEFDDVPSSLSDRLYSWTFTALVTASIKAANPVTGESVVGTLQMRPGVHPAPDTTLNVGDGQASYVVDEAGCCTAAWDTDGDGAYDDGSGATAAIPATPGRHTVGLRVTNGANRSTVVRKTFALAAKRLSGPPTLTPRLTLKPAITKARLGTLLKRGLVVEPGCAIACRATVVIAVDKATAKRLKLHSTRLGKRTARASKFTIKLTAKARRALRTTRSVRLKVTISATGADGRAVKSTKTVTLKR